MKNLSYLHGGGGKSTYSAPEIILIEVKAESGFATTDMTDTDHDAGLE